MKLSTKAMMELVEGDLTIPKLNDLAGVMPEILKNAKIIRPLIKRLVVTWSQADEQASLHAYRCLLAIVRNGDHVRNVVQNMYSAFVKNCKFVNPENVDHVRVMEGTLTSVLEQDLNESFHFAYMHVQNMAAHLRKAISQPRGDNLASVYNWQYIRSLSLWCRFLAQHTAHKQLSTLIYPLVQNIEGTLRLCPSARWIPLRFHCLEMLNSLSAAANLLIPVIPFIIDVFDIVDFNKRQPGGTSESSKPLNLSVMLRFSNSQMRDRQFRDAVMDTLYELLVENIHAHSKSICFPEYVRALVHELREFCRNCKIANYCKPIRVLLQKINENGLYVEHNRRSISDLNDKKAVVSDPNDKESVELLETVMRPPFAAFYQSYRTRRDEELRQMSSGKTEDQEEEEVEEEEEEEEEEEDAFMMDEEESEPENRIGKQAEGVIVDDILDGIDEEEEELVQDENFLMHEEPSPPRKRKGSPPHSATKEKRGRRRQDVNLVISDESSDVDMDSYLQTSLMGDPKQRDTSQRPLNKNLSKYFESRPRSDRKPSSKRGRQK